MNTCYNCLDRHIERGKGRHTALIYDSPLTGKIEMYSYQNLQNLVRTERRRLCGRKSFQTDWQNHVTSKLVTDNSIGNNYM